MIEAVGSFKVRIKNESIMLRRIIWELFTGTNHYSFTFPQVTFSKIDQANKKQSILSLYYVKPLPKDTLHHFRQALHAQLHFCKFIEDLGLHVQEEGFQVDSNNCSLMFKGDFSLRNRLTTSCSMQTGTTDSLIQEILFGFL